MRTLILSTVILLSFLGGPTLSAFAQDDPKEVPKAKAGSFGDRDDVAIQNKRFLKIRNETSDKLNVFVQYRTPEGGAWTWIPGDPTKTTDAISIEIEAGKEIDFQYKEEIAGASRMRIWATSPTQKWLKYKTKDIWLVPEKTEDGEHVYMAAGVETFNFVFSSSKDKGVIAGDGDTVGEQNLPTEGQNLPPPVPEIIWEDVPPNYPLIRDLAVLPVFSTGLNATVRVKNLGHFSANLNRRLIVQKLAAGAVPEDKGPIGPLFHDSVKIFFLVGMAPGNYVAFISPGDDAPFHVNDKKAFTITAAAFADVAVLPVTFAGGKVWLKVKNVGTKDVPAGQILKVMKLPAGVPTDHAIGALPVNDIKAFAGVVLPAGNYKAYVAPGDPAPHNGNDQKLFNVAAATFPDLDLLPVVVAAGKAHIKVKNIGTADSPAGPNLKTQKLPGGPVVDHGPVGMLPVNAVKAFAALALPPGNYKAFITPGDPPPHHANDAEMFVMPALAADLEATVPSKVGALVKATVHNNGPAAYAGAARTWHLEKMMGGVWAAIPTVGGNVIPAPAPGASHPVQGTFTGAGTYRLRISAGDANAGNDLKLKVLP